MNMKNKNAFTVTEIMLVCALIGVIAAIVVTVFVNSTQGTKIKTILQKGCSTLANVVNSATALNYSFATPDDAAKLMRAISENMNIKYYLNCSENGCETVFQNPEIGFWAVNEDNIAYKIERGNQNCADTITINTQASSKEAQDITCMSILIDSGCILKKSPSGCSEIQGSKNDILSGSFSGSQARVFMGRDGIAFGNEESVAAGIIMAQ